jgi:hypothetical protein
VSVDIKNCNKISLISDACGECSDGYELTQNDELCVNHITNCIEYQVTTVNSDGNHDYSCSRCDEKHYIDTAGNGGLGECKEGTVLNCLDYAFDKDECIKCEFGFYITSSTTCEASDLRNISPNCLETDTTQPDTCLKCKANYVLLERIEECALADKFKNAVNKQETKCIGWNSSTTCSDCFPMFYGPTCENETG